MQKKIIIIKIIKPLNSLGLNKPCTEILATKDFQLKCHFLFYS